VNGFGRRQARAPLRVALYSHDAMGLGHLRRNLAIAGVLADRGASVLLVAGTAEATAFRMPAGVDTLVLPSYAKSLTGGYGVRSLRLPLVELAAVRAQTLRGALWAFAPDVLVVDKLPLGVEGELEPALRALRLHGTRLVLGLRDILDDPEQVREDWRRQRFVDAVSRFFDVIWVYGDPAVYDPVEEYGMPPHMSRKVRYTGYIARRAESDPDESVRDAFGLPPGPLHMCAVGGGQDGFAVAHAFVRAALPAGAAGVVLAGPHMPEGSRRTLARACAAHGGMQLLDFVTDPEPLFATADSVVAMGGYNTVCELLVLGKRTLIVPRVAPRREQLLRAERLRGLGVADMLHPNELAPAAITRWLAGRGRRPDAAAAPGRMDLGGLARLLDLTVELLEARTCSLAPGR